MVELAHLRTVKQISETGSLAKAAARLNREQSAVSRQLAAFERECGGRLFLRNGRGMVLTELGQRILPNIDAMLAAEQEIIACQSALCGELAGQVRVAISPQIASYLYAPLIHRLQQTYPEIRLRLGEAYTETRADLDEGRTDIAVFMSADKRRAYQDRQIVELETYLIGPPDSPATRGGTIAFADLAALPLLLPPRPNAWRATFDQVAASKGIEPLIAAEVNASAVTVELVHAGIGHMIWPLPAGRIGGEMGWIAADVCHGRLSAARIVDPGFTFKLMISVGPGPSRRTTAVAGVIEGILGDLAGEAVGRDS